MVVEEEVRNNESIDKILMQRKPPSSEVLSKQ